MQIREIEGKTCRIYASDKADYVLIHPTGKHETEHIEEEYKLLLSETQAKFALVSFEISNWNNELSPWKAPQAFGDEPFGNGAEDTLDFIKEKLIPEISKELTLSENTRYICGGYSLAGLFSLWCAYNTDIFTAVSCCSPSVWIEGWKEYTDNTEPLVKNIYLSIGSKEHRTGNPILKIVRERIELQCRILTAEKINTSLEINPGNHFQDNTERMVKGYLWCMDNCS